MYKAPKYYDNALVIYKEIHISKQRLLVAAIENKDDIISKVIDSGYCQNLASTSVQGYKRPSWNAVFFV